MSASVEGGGSYYLIRWLCGAKPGVAKLAIFQDRLYCLRLRAAKPASPSFFDEPSALRDELEAIASSYRATAISYPCLGRSNEGVAPRAGLCAPAPS